MSNHLIEIGEDIWIDPEMVTALRPWRFDDEYTEARVFLHGGKVVARAFKSEAEAKSFIADLASDINGIRSLIES